MFSARRMMVTVTTAGLASVLAMSAVVPASAAARVAMGPFSSLAQCREVRNAYIADYRTVSACFQGGGIHFTYDPGSIRY